MSGSSSFTEFERTRQRSVVLEDNKLYRVWMDAGGRGRCWDGSVTVSITRVRLHKSATPKNIGSTNTTCLLPLLDSLLIGKTKKVEERVERKNSRKGQKYSRCNPPPPHHSGLWRNGKDRQRWSLFCICCKDAPYAVGILSVPQSKH